MSFSAYRRGLRFRDMTRPHTLGVGRGTRLFTRPPLDRMHKIFCAIRAGDCPNRTGLAGEIEVTTKTIQRDIDFMRDRLNLSAAFS